MDGAARTGGTETGPGVRPPAAPRRLAPPRRARTALGAGFLLLAAAGAASGGERVRLRKVPVTSTEGAATLAGGDDGSAYVQVLVQEGNTLFWRRVHSAPDGTRSEADVPIDARGPFDDSVTDGSGTTACLAPWRIVRIDPGGATSQSAGTAGVPRGATMRDGAIAIVEERPGAAERTAWGVEIVRRDGTRVDVPDLGVARRWRLADGGPLPGLDGATESSSQPLSVRWDDEGRVLVLFAVQRRTGPSRGQDALEARSIGSDGSVSAVALPDVSSQTDPPDLRISGGGFARGDDGTLRLLRQVVDADRLSLGRSDIAIVAPGGTVSRRSYDVGGGRFPGGSGRAQGDVSARRTVLVGPEADSRRVGGAVQHTLRLAWHRVDVTSEGSLRSRDRVLATRLASTSGGASAFEVRSFSVAVAPDGACAAAVVTRARPGARERLLVWIVAPDGRVLRRFSRPVAGDPGVGTAACGDRGFVVLAARPTGGEMTALHFLR